MDVKRGFSLALSACVFLAGARCGWAQGEARESPVDSTTEAARAGDFSGAFVPTATTRSVERALAFLAAGQLADGSWLSGWGKNTGVVSLALLAFLSAGHVPGRGPYGEIVERGIHFLLEHAPGPLLVDERGASHGPLYEHGITTLLLGEVSGLVDISKPGFERFTTVHRDAVTTILRAQQVDSLLEADRGGWRYTLRSRDADLSVSGWQLLALRAAEDAQVEIPAARIQAAVDYVRRAAHPSGGFTYMPARAHIPSRAMTGTGILALQIGGEFHAREALRGGDWLLKHPPKWEGPFLFYGLYYSTQGMFQLGGTYWEQWRRRCHPLLLAHQSEDGSWHAPAGETSVVSQLGPVYTTALAVLSLTVEFKYLPIYQR